MSPLRKKMDMLTSLAMLMHIMLGVNWIDALLLDIVVIQMEILLLGIARSTMLSLDLVLKMSTELAQGTCEILWVKSLIREFGYRIDFAIPL